MKTTIKLLLTAIFAVLMAFGATAKTDGEEPIIILNPDINHHENN